MKVLDATFLIDYLDGIDATAEYLLRHEDDVFVAPVPAYTEALVGEGNYSDGKPARTRSELSWLDIHDVDEETAVTASEIADEIPPQGPSLSGMDALIAAVGRELGAPVVSNDRDLTHDETKSVVDVEEYR